jgi:hypothetical protein
MDKTTLIFCALVNACFSRSVKLLFLCVSIFKARLWDNRARQGGMSWSFRSVCWHALRFRKLITLTLCLTFWFSLAFRVILGVSER